MGNNKNDSNFILQGTKPPTRQKSEEYLTNSQKTISSSKLNSSMSLPKDKSSLSIEELQQSVDKLKLDMTKLNETLQSKYGSSLIYHEKDLKSFDESKVEVSSEDPDLTYMFQREDDEAVSQPPHKDPQWFNNPKHLTKQLGDFPVMNKSGISDRLVRTTGRPNGTFGSEYFTKKENSDLNLITLAASTEHFPIRLTSPHIIGIRSLLPPKYSVRGQNPERAKSPLKRASDSIESTILFNGSTTFEAVNKKNRKNRSLSPRAVWMPTTPKANASGTPIPKFSQERKSRSKQRPATANGFRRKTSFKTSYNPSSYQRPSLYPLPGETELNFLRSADALDTRGALVDNSPYQQALSKLRLERLRVEEEYLLQLKRESELERIRGPKPKWYESKGPQFHYECNKNTELHRNSKNWSDSLEYRKELLCASREFTLNMKNPVSSIQ